MSAEGEQEPPIVTLVNLWAKQLIVGDVITEIHPVDTRYGVLHSYTVERTVAAHEAEKARIAKQKKEDN